MSFVPHPIQRMRTEGRTSLRPEDVKAYGVKRFLDEQEARGSLQLPKLHSTEEENQLMDELLAEEKAASTHAA